jgi:hypothetical protein
MNRVEFLLYITVSESALWYIVMTQEIHYYAFFHENQMKYFVYP